jgi:hypothetical protein
LDALEYFKSQELKSPDAPKPLVYTGAPNVSTPIGYSQPMMGDQTLEQFQQDNVQLQDGSWVTKEEYDKLSEEDKAYILANGIEAYNKYKQEQLEIFEAAHVKLNDESWVSKEEYDKLSEEDKAYLMQNGIEAFNTYKNTQLTEFKTTHIQLGDESWVSKEEFDKLSEEDKAYLTANGIEAFNIYRQAQLQEFESTHVKLNDGTWVTKTEYDKLSEEDKLYLINNGVTSYTAMVTERYNTAKSTLQNFINPDGTLRLNEAVNAGITDLSVYKNAGYNVTQIDVDNIKNIPQYEEPTPLPTPIEPHPFDPTYGNYVLTKPDENDPTTWIFTDPMTGEQYDYNGNYIGSIPPPTPPANQPTVVSPTEVAPIPETEAHPFDPTFGNYDYDSETGIYTDPITGEQYDTNGKYLGNVAPQTLPNYTPQLVNISPTAPNVVEAYNPDNNMGLTTAPSYGAIDISSGMIWDGTKWITSAEAKERGIESRGYYDPMQRSEGGQLTGGNYIISNGILIPTTFDPTKIAPSNITIEGDLGTGYVIKIDGNVLSTQGMTPDQVTRWIADMGGNQMAIMQWVMTDVGMRGGMAGADNLALKASETYQYLTNTYNNSTGQLQYQTGVTLGLFKDTDIPIFNDEGKISGIITSEMQKDMSSEILDILRSADRNSIDSVNKAIEIANNLYKGNEINMDDMSFLVDVLGQEKADQWVANIRAKLAEQQAIADYNNDLVTTLSTSIYNDISNGREPNFQYVALLKTLLGEEGEKIVNEWIDKITTQGIKIKALSSSILNAIENSGKANPDDVAELEKLLDPQAVAEWIDNLKSDKFTKGLKGTTLQQASQNISQVLAENPDAELDANDVSGLIWGMGQDEANDWIEKVRQQNRDINILSEKIQNDIWNGKAPNPEDVAQLSDLVTPQTAQAWITTLSDKQKGFADSLKALPQELQDAYAMGGMEGYLQAVDAYNKNLEENFTIVGRDGNGNPLYLSNTEHVALMDRLSKDPDGFNIYQERGLQGYYQYVVDREKLLGEYGIIQDGKININNLTNSVKGGLVTASFVAGGTGLSVDDINKTVNAVDKLRLDGYMSMDGSSINVYKIIMDGGKDINYAKALLGEDIINQYEADIQNQYSAQRSLTYSLLPFATNNIELSSLGVEPKLTDLKLTNQGLTNFLVANNNSQEARQKLKDAGFTEEDIKDVSIKAQTTIDSLNNIQTKLNNKTLARTEHEALTNAMKLNGAELEFKGGIYYANGQELPQNVYDYLDRTIQIWNTLSDEQKALVSQTYDADEFKGNPFAEFINTTNIASANNIPLQLITSPISIIGTPIAKVTTGQNTTPLEWAEAGAMAVIIALSLGGGVVLGTARGAVVASGDIIGGLGSKVGLGTAGKVITYGLETGATSIFVAPTIPVILDPKTSALDRNVAIAFDVLMIGGLLLGGHSLAKSITESVKKGKAIPVNIAKEAETQNKILNTVIQANKDFISKELIKDPIQAQKLEIAYNNMAKAIDDYSKTSLELKQTQKAISDIEFAKNPAELDLLNKLKAKADDLTIKLNGLQKPLDSSVKYYNDLLGKNLIGAPPEVISALDEMPKTIRTQVDAVTTEIVAPRNMESIARDITDVSNQKDYISDYLKNNKVTTQELMDYNRILDDLQSQLASLEKESRLKFLETGEIIKTTEGGYEIEAKSLQQRLLDINKDIETLKKTSTSTLNPPLEMAIGKVTIERDIFEGIQRTTETVDKTGRKSYGYILEQLNQNLNDLIKILDDSGLPKERYVDVILDFSKGIRLKDVKLLNSAIAKLQLEAGKLPPQAKLLTDAKIKLLGTYADDVLSRFKGVDTFTNPIKSSTGDIFRAVKDVDYDRIINENIKAQAERIVYDRISKLVERLPSNIGRRKMAEILDYLKKTTYDDKYFTENYGGKYKNLDEFLDIEKIEAELREELKRRKEIEEMKADIASHEAEKANADRFKDSVSNPDLKKKLEDYSNNFKKIIEEKKKQVQTAEANKTIQTIRVITPEEEANLPKPTVMEKAGELSKVEEKEKTLQEKLDEAKAKEEAERKVKEAKRKLEEEKAATENHEDIRKKYGLSSSYIPRRWEETPVTVQPKTTFTPSETPSTEPSITPLIIPEPEVEPTEVPSTEPVPTREPNPFEIPDNPFDFPEVIPTTTPVTTPETEPVEIPAEKPSPKETPVEIPTVTPIKTPEGIPAESPVVTPVETPIELPAETPIETPVVTPIESPVETPIVTPEITPIEVTAEVPLEIPVVSEEIETKTPTEVITETTTENKVIEETVKKLPKPPFIMPTIEEGGLPKDKQGLKGTFQWRQGIYYEVIPPPYDKIYHLTRPLPGTTKFATGRGSAYKTLECLYGKPEKDVDLDLGWAKVSIKTKGGQLHMSFGGGKEAIESRWAGEKARDIERNIDKGIEPYEELKERVEALESGGAPPVPPEEPPITAVSPEEPEEIASSIEPQEEVKEGYVRLYRVERKGEHRTNLPFGTPEELSGRWFTDDPELASWYYERLPAGRNLMFVDVPIEVAEKNKIVNLPATHKAQISKSPNKEYILPQELVDKSKKMSAYNLPIETPEEEITEESEIDNLFKGQENLWEGTARYKNLSDHEKDSYDFSEIPEGEISEKIPRGLSKKQEPPRGLQKMELPQYKSGRIKVYLVNGDYVRSVMSKENPEAIDFTQGNNFMVGSYVPNLEIWIDKANSLTDRKATLLHEFREVRDMQEGTEYEDAHSDAANPLELEARHNVSKLDEMLKDEISRAYVSPKKKQRIKIPDENGNEEEYIPVSYLRRVGGKPKIVEDNKDRIATRYYLGKPIKPVIEDVNL